MLPEERAAPRCLLMVAKSLYDGCSQRRRGHGSLLLPHRSLVTVWPNSPASPQVALLLAPASNETPMAAGSADSGTPSGATSSIRLQLDSVVAPR